MPDYRPIPPWELRKRRYGYPPLVTPQAEEDDPWAVLADLEKNPPARTNFEPLPPLTGIDTKPEGVHPPGMFGMSEADPTLPEPPDESEPEMLSGDPAEYGHWQMEMLRHGPGGERKEAEEALSALEAEAAAAPKPEGTEPWQLSGEDRQWQRRNDAEIGRLRGLKNVAEGLGNIRWTTPGHYYLGREAPEPNYVAEDVRAEMAKRSDLLSPAERAVIKDRWGMDLPQDARWSRVSKSLPYVSRAMRGGYTDWMGQQRLDLQRELEAGREARSLRNARLREQGLEQQDEQFDYRKTTVPDVDRRSLSGKRFIMGQVRKLKTEMGDDIGPIWGRWQTMLSRYGLAGPDATRDNARVAFITSQFIYEMTGKQLNNMELERLALVTPQMYQNPAAFKAQMDNFLTTIEDKYNEELRGLEAQGRDTTAWQLTENEDTTTASHDTATKILYISPEGAEVFVPANTDMTEYLRKGWRKK